MVQQWISVEDRLPDSIADVLVFDSLDMFVAFYSHKIKEWLVMAPDHIDKIEGVTHWMPLPNPPKQQEQEQK